MTIPSLASARLDVQRAEHAFRHPKSGIADADRDQLANLLSQARANLRLVERAERGEPIRGEIAPIVIPVELVDGPLPGNPLGTAAPAPAPAEGGPMLASGPGFDPRPFARAADDSGQARLLASALRQLVELAGRPVTPATARIADELRRS